MAGGSYLLYVHCANNLGHDLPLCTDLLLILRALCSMQNTYTLLPQNALGLQRAAKLFARAMPVNSSTMACRNVANHRLRVRAWLSFTRLKFTRGRQCDNQDFRNTANMMAPLLPLSRALMLVHPTPPTNTVAWEST